MSQSLLLVDRSFLLYSQKRFAFHSSSNQYPTNGRCHLDPQKLKLMNWFVDWWSVVPMRTLRILAHPSISISSLKSMVKRGFLFAQEKIVLGRSSGDEGRREAYQLCALADFGVKYWRNVRHGSKVWTRQDLCKHLNQTQVHHCWGSQKRDN